MKVLVIGREGQLARSLVDAAKQAGVEVVAVGRPEIDLAMPSTIGGAISQHAPGLVINVAAYTAVDQAEKEPALAFAINADGAGHVARACAAADVPLMHISTDYVFDGSKTSAYVEDDAVSPLGVYGSSKLEGERQVAAAHARHVIVRTAWVVSPFGHNFVKTMLRLAQSRPEISVVGDQIGCPTYAPHLASALLAVAQQIGRRDRAAAPWGVYHATGTGEATWFDLAQEVFAQSRRHGGAAASVKPITTAEYPTPARRPANSRLDCGKLARTFDVRLPDWRDGIAECVAVLSEGATLAEQKSLGGKT